MACHPAFPAARLIDLWSLPRAAHRGVLLVAGGLVGSGCRALLHRRFRPVLYAARLGEDELEAPTIRGGMFLFPGFPC